MGTRCLTTVVDGNKEILVMYRQMDGYPSGHGVELLKFAKGFNIVNGLSMDPKKADKIANGMGCFAAQLVAHFKTEPGGFYLYAPETRECGEEYVYNLSAKEDPKTGKKRLWLDLQEGEVAFFGLPGTKPALMDWIYSGWLDGFSAEKAEKGSVHH